MLSRILVRLITIYTKSVGQSVILSDVPLHKFMYVHSVQQERSGDWVAQRLIELGFFPGERVRVVATGPIQREPLLVEVGCTHFALRKAEAARVLVTDVAGQPI